MFGTSNFSTAVTSAPSCGLWHQMLTSTPNSIEMLTSAPWKSSVPKLLTWAEVNIWCRSSCAEVNPCRSSFTRNKDGLKRPSQVSSLLLAIAEKRRSFPNRLLHLEQVWAITYRPYDMGHILWSILTIEFGVKSTLSCCVHFLGAWYEWEF